MSPNLLQSEKEVNLLLYDNIVVTNIPQSYGNAISRFVYIENLSLKDTDVTLNEYVEIAKMYMNFNPDYKGRLFIYKSDLREDDFIISKETDYETNDVTEFYEYCVNNWKSDTKNEEK